MPPDTTNEADVNTEPYVPVGEFFAERSVFVTGATGFLGKVLVEKLLRSCPGVKVIYLLVRPKKGRGLEERLADIVASPLFDRLKKEQPSAINKIIAIQGDITEPALGISLVDQEILTQNVSVVFHSAATVKFNEPLKVALDINLLGTQRLLELCRRMPELKTLVHVSTGYSNSNLEEIDEVVYPPPYDHKRVVECTQWMDDETLEKVTPILVEKLSNTYMLAKQLTETMLAKEGVGLPIAIVKPTIIISTWKEPIAGWIEGLMGPTGVLFAYGKGMIRALPCDGSKVIDIVPVDVVVNHMIAVAWKTSTGRKDQLVVYTCCSGRQNPLKMDKVLDSIYKTVRSNPPEQVVWYPPTDIDNKNLYMFRLKDIFYHLLPAHLMDLISKLSGKTPIIVRLDEKIRRHLQESLWGSMREWRFINDNTINLNKCLSEHDRQVFYTDVSDIDWPSYLVDYIMGVRQHIHKEHPDTIPQSKTSLKRLLWIKRASQLFGLFLVLQAGWFMFF